MLGVLQEVAMCPLSSTISETTSEDAFMDERSRRTSHEFLFCKCGNLSFATQTLRYGLMTFCQLILHILQTLGPRATAETDLPAAERPTCAQLTARSQ